MTAELLSISSIRENLKPDALAYLQTHIPEADRIGVHRFVETQRQVFNQHASHLAVVLNVIQQAPKSLNLHHFEQHFIEWLRENGVSSARITQLKGAIRLKTRAASEDSFYSPIQKEMIQDLEIEKAYIFGRLSWEGQAKATVLYQEQGKLTLKELRTLVKDFAYDPKQSWADSWSRNKQTQAGNDEEIIPKTPVSIKAYDLAIQLQGVVDELLDIQHLWAEDPRVKDLLDVKRLTRLTELMCAGRDTGIGYDF